MYVIMYIAHRPLSINVCGEINRVTAVAAGLLLLISAVVRNENLDIAEHSKCPLLMVMQILGEK
jgi:hypothetical protein